MPGTAVVYVDADGNVTFHHSSDVVFLSIDDRAPADRVYCFDNPASDNDIKVMVGTSKVGNPYENSAAIRRVSSAITGRDDDYIGGKPN